MLSRSRCNSAAETTWDQGRSNATVMELLRKPAHAAARLFGRPSFLFLLVLSGLCVGGLLWWPIVLTDTDLWYHLTGGRYFFEHHSIPQSSFFSFISPPRVWANYYWLFQVSVYGLYTWSGYYGLILLRAVAYLATILCIVRYVFRGPERSTYFSWYAFVAILYTVLLLPRAIAVRPHSMSYFFIVAFLSFLEDHPRRRWWLPVLAILWVNLHGIEYPVMLLMLGAYGLDALLAFRRSPRVANAAMWRGMIPLVLSAAVLCLPPHGLRLLDVPFRPLGFISHHVLELMPLTLDQLLSLHVSAMTPSYQAIFNVFFLTSSLVALSAFVRRRLNVVHALLWGGGLVLLTTANRFTYEYALLSLPLLRAYPLCSPKQLSQHLPRPACLGLVVVLMAMTIQCVTSLFGARPAYPFSSVGLPQGVVTFLNRIEAKGSILNHPNFGGYLQWKLYPTYRIFLDMEVGPLFSASDYFVARQILVDVDALRKFLARYDPSFITLPYADTFKDLLKQFPDYALVFLDDAGVLYVQRHHYPALAATYELKDVDPFELHERWPTAIDADPAREPILKYLPRLLAIYPECGIVNYIAGTVYNQSGLYDHALPYAKTIIRHFPHRAVGYELQGDALMGLQLFEAAIASYRAALKAEGSAARLYTKLGTAYFGRQQYAAAYQAFEHGIEVFAPMTPINETFNLGLSARLSGRRSEAETIMRYLYDYRVTPEDEGWSEKLKRELVLLGAAR